ncbi:MAG: hypothetical protein ACD_38C00074G0003 [uncultured bacterium]|uniref:Uncharacterized protein n=1 Tax=Candidatus Daviesbacteria bacterium GW2011_GWC2_40_12 TaxID=1618431 RepID=A0A0G0TUC6_9BACT|nr:MAG: hypothetical protein ACD_38C00074G0003 [uncultured bacterium]KKR16014.1 MAG: hypothetical protein UT45_C0010G0028 [Candidatus Daviesbacteria bacterium GW2011_GWA2_39_33]KKR41502.1 MAG: hypothetical protein UT77_C0010G0028 [Candidatus Daviesbacteria bacterium GW2011_GWC2_40_12]OGE21854.1 MAG: hypothetical protein A2778_03060 [Candidatus Daviesbacteria bacterium RIFCSPHIGHO2_01_FULL_40_24]OGE29877.1 MAG: hypothetical protein A3C29_02550 [Candidatus Daviesbacteria bacterium RIFCSPHIGHO2_02
MKKIKKILAKAVPLWMVILITINSTMIMGIAQYYLMRAELRRNLSELAKTTKSPEDLVTILKQEVLPQDGYTTSLKWKDLGKQLVESGAIDKKKYEEIFTSTSDGADHMKYLNEASEDNIRIDEKNSRFMVNTFWALGLVQKSKVLDEGPMKTGGTPTENFASTGGWTLGAKPVMEIYSSRELLPLNSFQQDLVKKIAENVFRPCCGNSTAFPDCNHGMAALGYIEWAIYNGLPEEQIYKDLLAFNVFWFPQNYVEMAVYFDKNGTKWKNVDPKLALGSEYSSAQGAQRIKQSVQSVPGLQIQGGGCGV